jgi:SAM-dependent methyltransferase
MFPGVNIGAGDIDEGAVEFCRRLFQAHPLQSDVHFSILDRPHSFDLIWCGSLLTHLSQESSLALLGKFRRCLRPSGVCVFTTQGELSASWIRDRTVTYGLTPELQTTILRDFDETGYGFSLLDSNPSYGISLIAHDRVLELAARVGGWRKLLYIEQGWDSHQDVYAYQMEDD